MRRLNNGEVAGRPNLVTAKLLEHDIALDGSSRTVTFSATAESSNARIVTATVKSRDGTALTVARGVTLWVSATAGGVPAATPPDGATSITTGVLLLANTAKVLFTATTDATGVIAVTITETGVKSFYVNLAIGGEIFSSTAIVFA